MDIAVIKTGGKQYLVKEGQYLMIEKMRDVKEGDDVSFDVLLSDNGSETNVGSPMVHGAKVGAKVIGMGRARKVVVVKYKAKSRYYKKRGHKQPFLKVKIEKI